MRAPSTVPAQLIAEYAGWRTELLQAPYRTATWKLTSPVGEVRYAKVAWDDLYPTLAYERDRIAWAHGMLPVPQVAGYGHEDHVEWLVTGALPGTDATRVTHDPADVVRALGEGLRRFHDRAPVASCPFDFTLDVSIAHCTARVAEGTETWDDLHDDFKDHTPQTALDELIATRPSSEDIVVCHGDYCFPNMLMQDGVVTGYIDLGELGLADRWWDIAVGAWSVTWNVDPSLEPLFYEAYGVEPDLARIRFYRLMYDLSS